MCLLGGRSGYFDSYIYTARGWFLLCFLGKKLKKLSAKSEEELSQRREGAENAEEDQNAPATQR